MPSRNPATTILCGDVKKALRTQRRLLGNVESSLRCPYCGAELATSEAPSVDLDPPAEPLPRIIPPVIVGTSCAEALHALGASGVSLRRVLVAMRVLTEIPLQALDSLPDDHAFALPAGAGAPGTGRAPRARKAST